MSCTIEEIKDPLSHIEESAKLAAEHNGVVINNYLYADDFEERRTVLLCTQVFSVTVGLSQYRHPEVIVFGGPGYDEFYSEQDVEKSLTGINRFLKELVEEILSNSAPSSSASRGAIWLKDVSLKLKSVGKIGERVYYADYVKFKPKEDGVSISDSNTTLSSNKKLSDNIVKIVSDELTVTAGLKNVIEDAHENDSVEFLVFVPMDYILKKPSDSDEKLLN